MAAQGCCCICFGYRFGQADHEVLLLVLSRKGADNDRFIAPVMHRVRMLIHFGITPYFVFDGDYLPSKAVTEISRAARRAESLKLGNSLMSMGKKAEAYKEFIKAIDITPEMARLLIEELKKNKIQYVVAPYEADAQLAYLERKGLIHGVISEDSDLLVFGTKRLLTKLDDHGNCIEINRRDFSALESIHIAGWTDSEFRRMAILSGCDYLPNIERIGLKTAYQLVRKHKDIERIIQVLSLGGKHTVPPDYLAEFTKAELTFLHQRVFCPEQQQLVMLTPFSGEEPEDFDFIGKHIDPVIARQVARGDLNPNTKKPIKLIYDLEGYRPSPNSLRRSKSVQTVSELKGKPINEFFRSTRVPLAELDPNSFTPSPSQRQVLQRQPYSFESTPVMGISNGRPTAIASAPAAIGGVRGRVPSATQGHPSSKRQRLCANDKPADSAVEVRSRFFMPSASDPSPLQRMSGDKKNDNELWSDESLDAALAELPDDFDTPSNNRKVKVFTQLEFEMDKPNQAEAKSKMSADSIPPTQAEPSFDKSSTEFQNLYPTIKPSAKKMTSSFAELAKKYTLDCNVPARSSKPSATLSRSASTNISQKSPFFTPPVSRSSSRLSITTSITDIIYPSLPPDSEDDPEPDLPQLIPESPLSKDRKSSNVVKGSEDCIVPCSDIESEIEEALAREEELSRAESAAAEEAEEKVTLPKSRAFGAWDLAKYAFTG